MHVVRKLIAGDPVRRTRLHTEAGEFCGVQALGGLVASGLTWSRERLVGMRAVQPWWVWGAIRFVERQLRPSDRVLEIGGGSSTLWLAQRCAAVVTLEESAPWREEIRARALSLGLRNITLHEGPSWPVFASLQAAERWDVLVIDGPRPRLRFFQRAALEAFWRRPRVMVYDDTDRPENRPALQSACSREAHAFRGFKPQTLHACETSVFVRRDR